MSRWLSAWGFALGYMALLYWMSSQAVPAPGLDLGPGADKVAHAGLYLVLTFLLTRAVHATGPGLRPWIWPAVGLLGAVVFGVADELHQATVPVRDASPGDVVADAVGSLLGLAAWAFHRRLLPREGQDVAR